MGRLSGRGRPALHPRSVRAAICPRTRVHVTQERARCSPRATGHGARVRAATASSDHPVQVDSQALQCRSALCECPCLPSLPRAVSVTVPGRERWCQACLTPAGSQTQESTLRRRTSLLGTMCSTVTAPSSARVLGAFPPSALVSARVSLCWEEFGEPELNPALGMGENVTGVTCRHHTPVSEWKGVFLPWSVCPWKALCDRQWLCPSVVSAEIRFHLLFAGVGR